MIKYDANGNHLWSRQSETSDAQDESYWAVAVDGGDDVYAVGSNARPSQVVIGGTIVDFIVVKYNSEGNLLWRRQLAISGGADTGLGVATDAAGGVYVAGRTGGSFDIPNMGGNDAFLARFDTDGNFDWARQFGSSSFDEANDVAVDADGNIHVVGFTQGPTLGLAHGILRKYDSLGNILSTRQISTETADFALGISFDGSSDVYVAGQTDGSLGGPHLGSLDAWLARFNIGSPGDYNGNGIVDAADYTVWRDMLGQTGAGLAADGNGDNMVTQADYDVWKSNFGMTAGSGSGSGSAGASPSLGAVPEPSTLLLAIAAAAIFLTLRGKNQCPRRVAGVEAPPSPQHAEELGAR